MNSIQVQEYGDTFSLEIKNKTNEDIRKIIDRLNEKYKKKLHLRNTPFQINAENKFRIRDITGQIRISNLDLVIVPKYLQIDDSQKWLKALMQMLHIANTKSYSPYSSVKGSKNRLYFFDFIARNFIYLLAPAIKDGLPLGYVKQKQESSFLRGRLDIIQQAKNIFTKPHVVACITETLTENIPLSIVLKWACRFLSYQVTNVFLRHRLSEFLESFSEVSDILPPSGIIDRLGILGTQIRYQKPFEIAQLLIKQRGQNFDPKTSQIPGILFDSSTVFEEFISGCLARIARRNEGWTHRRQKQFILATNPKNPIDIQPDDVLRVNGNVALVLDSKYKKDTLKYTTDPDPNSSDVYQLICSCQAASSNYGVLIYPSAKFVDLSEYKIVKEQKPKKFFTLGIPPMELAEQDGESRIITYLEKKIQKIINASI